jgi:XTP/dITP diphosphohydrolase
VKLLVATRSAHKLSEIRAILGAVPGVEVLGLVEAGIPHDPAEDALEPHDTFEANALSKARWFHELSGLPAVADDSGLVVDALGGEPGVRSKRFAPGDEQGEARDRANNRHLLSRLAGLPAEARTARYVCAVALVGTSEGPVVLRGEAEGRILDEPRGRGGFGYDPLFFDPGLGRTFAEVAPEDKNARSHRGRAFRALADRLGRP